MSKHKIMVEKTARYFTSGSEGAQIETILFVCHGYATLAEKFLQEFKDVQSDNLFIVAPEGLNRFYTRGGSGNVVASWMTSDDREDEIQDYINFLDQVYKKVVPKFPVNTRIAVLGFSQGAATASRWAASGKSRIDDLILWCGFFPPDLKTAEIPEHLRLTVVTASDDKWIGPEEEQKQLEGMKKRTPDFKHFRFTGEHKIHVPALKTILSEW